MTDQLTEGTGQLGEQAGADMPALPPLPQAPWEGTAEGVADLLKATRAHVVETEHVSVELFQDPLSETMAPVIVSKDGVLPVPDSVFAPYRKAPVDRMGTATLTSLDSFIGHVNAYKSTIRTALFASDSRSAPSITAVYDYNDPLWRNLGEFAVVNETTGLEEVAGGAQFQRHRAHHAFPLSDEWRAWLAHNGKVMSMPDFAAFLEDRVIDVQSGAEPGMLSPDMTKYVTALGSNIADANKLIELSRGLKVYEESRFAQAANINSGEVTLMFQTENRDEQGAPLVVPNLFLIAIPVFQHGDPFLMAARLRYRKKDGSLVFWYDLWRTDRVFDVAFKESIERAKVETGCPLYLGKPEIEHATIPTHRG